MFSVTSIYFTISFSSAVGTYSGKDVGMSAPVHVSYNGEVVWYSTIIIKTFCKMKVLYFPFDEQFCPMKFSSWSHNETEIILKSAEDTSRVTMNYTGSLILSSSTKKEVGGTLLYRDICVFCLYSKPPSLCMLSGPV